MGTKLIDADDFMLMGKIYFLIGGGINILCAILFVVMKHTNLIKYYLYRSNKEANQDYFSRYDSINFHSKSTLELIEQKRMEKKLLKAYDDEHEPEQRLRLLSNENDGQLNEASYCSVLNEIKYLAMGTFVVMMTTFLYFPGLMTSIKSQYEIFEKDDDWFGIMLIFEYNIFDYIGRQFVAKYELFVNERNILAVAIGRGFVICPVFFILSRQYVVSDVLLHSINIVGALSNGYLICLMFIFLSEISSKDRNNKSTFNHISATILVLALNLGILAGSVAVIVIERFV